MVVAEDPIRQVELAEEAIATADAEAAAEHLSAAIRCFTAAGDRRRAAMACARLGDLFANAIGNQTAGRAWFNRATRLLEDEPPCVEQGWVAVAALGCDVDEPLVLLASAEVALERARRFGDVNLETKALADGGLAQVQIGRLAEGTAMLDETMALACGPADDVEAAGKSVCSFLTACYYAADFERVDAWARILCRHGLLGNASGAPIILGNHCDAVQATLLCEVGRWSEAEDLLTRAIRDFETTMSMPSWHPVIALAELRIRQGRLADAEMLLLGKEGHFQALLPSARLHLARGDFALARATAVRGLRAIGRDRLRAAELFAVLVDIELGAGDVEAAQAALENLVGRAEPLDLPGLQSRMATAHSRVLTATGELIGAIATIEVALDRLPETGVPLLRALHLVDLVRLHDRLGNWAAATIEARRAGAALSELDVVLPPADSALLERFDGSASPTSSRAPRLTATLGMQDGGWIAVCGDARARFADAKGFHYLAELVLRPGLERHALDLVDRLEGVAGGGAGPDRRHLGDAGELVDARARSAYRHRIEALRSEIDEAFGAGADAQAEVLQGELDQLVGELARAFGLGGRSRRASSAPERARLNVTRALRTATAKLCVALPQGVKQSRPGGAAMAKIRDTQTGSR